MIQFGSYSNGSTGRKMNPEPSDHPRASEFHGMNRTDRVLILVIELTFDLTRVSVGCRIDVSIDSTMESRWGVVMGY